MSDTDPGTTPATDEAARDTVTTPVGKFQIPTWSIGIVAIIVALPWSASYFWGDRVDRYLDTQDALVASEIPETLADHTTRIESLEVTEGRGMKMLCVLGSHLGAIMPDCPAPGSTP